MENKEPQEEKTLGTAIRDAVGIAAIVGIASAVGVAPVYVTTAAAMGIANWCRVYIAGGR